MAKNKGMPKKLTEKQERLRQQSINKVLRAMEDLKAEGRKVTITALMEVTGLSRSVLSKGYIRELLENYRYSGIKMSANKKKSVVVVADKDRKIRELRTQVEELEWECKLLREKLFLLMRNKKKRRFE